MSDNIKELSAKLHEVEDRVVQAQAVLEEAQAERSEVLKAIAVAIAPQKQITIRNAAGERVEYTICVRAKSGLYYLKGKSENQKQAVDL